MVACSQTGVLSQTVTLVKRVLCVKLTKALARRCQKGDTENKWDCGDWVNSAKRIELHKKFLELHSKEALASFDRKEEECVE